MGDLIRWKIAAFRNLQLLVSIDVKTTTRAFLILSLDSAYKIVFKKVRTPLELLIHKLTFWQLMENDAATGYPKAVLNETHMFECRAQQYQIFCATAVCQSKKRVMNIVFN